MDILDIAIAKQLAGGGGGSGTDNYNDLSNLPKINDVTLSGNKSSSALGLQSEITSENKLDSDLIDDTDQDNKFVTSSEKNIWNAKQNAIDADHKLNADYVDDSTSTNKFVTASDKEAWNAKQNAIDNSHKLSSDLVDDANHTNKFVTSTEKNTWNGKQNAIDSEHKLSSSLVSFTTAEAAALASGIDSTKVAQISTNQSNILYNLNMGVKNKIPYRTSPHAVSDTGITVSIDDDNTYKITGTKTISDSYIELDNIISSELAGDHVASISVSGTGDCQIAAYGYNGSTWTLMLTTSTAQGFSVGSYTIIKFRIRFTGSINSSYNAIVKPMVCKMEAWNQSHDWQPPALPNYDLTRLEAEDRAGLIECVDGGAKNVLQYTLDDLKRWNTSGTWNGNAYTQGGVTYTVNNDMTVVTSGSSTANSNLIIYNPSGNTTYTSQMIISGCPDGGNYDTKYAIYVADQNASTIVTTANSNGSKIPVNTAFKYIAILFRSGTSAAGLTFKPMICTKAAFGVSKAFVPYRPNYDLVGSTTNALLATAYNTVTPVNNYVTNIEGGYIRIGNLVVVNVKCTVNTNIPGSTPFIDGLPKPIINYNTGFGGASVVNNKNYSLQVIGTGSIAYAASSESIPSATTLVMNCTYFTK